MFAQACIRTVAASRERPGQTPGLGEAGAGAARAPPVTASPPGGSPGGGRAPRMRRIVEGGRRTLV